ncbi:MAG: hypothetical protein AB7P03_14470 [Kofleriaceae bacterium]
MRVAVLIIIAVIVVARAPRRAEAYPEWQFSTGATRCSECHFSPAGGGLINDYGRDEAGSTIAGGGDGRFLHGAVELPGWMALGGDVRLAGMAKQVRGGNEGAVFPMQGDLYARFGTGGWSVQGTVGVLAAVREPRPISDRIGSREHYVMYQPGSRAWYVRAGRMFPVFGLRVPDHTAYVRRYTGQHTLEESYAIGAGIARTAWDVHVTALTPLTAPPRVGRHGPGGAVSIERYIRDDTGSVGAQIMARQLATGVEGWAGATFKNWLESTNLMIAAELDYGWETIDGGSTVHRLAGYAALHIRPAASLGGAIAAHIYDADLQLGDNERVALEARMASFPYAHFEIAPLLRVEGVRGELHRGTVLGLLQLHYFL